MLNLHPLECTIKDNDHIPDLLLIKYWGIISCKYFFCVGLTSINIPNSITILSDQVFRGCTNLKKFVVSNDNPRYSAIDGVLYNKNKTKLLSYPNAKSSTYTVPDGITSIGDYAFSDCIGLTSITIPNSVIEIGNSILSGCRNLQKLSLPFIGSSIKLQEHLGYLFELRSNYKAPPNKVMSLLHTGVMFLGFTVIIFHYR